MKAVITVTGKDTVGIIASIANKCAEHSANIVDISQSVLRDEYFAMIMLADIDRLQIPFTEFIDILAEEGRKNGLVVHTMHEDIFNSMHRI